MIGVVGKGVIDGGLSSGLAEARQQLTMLLPPRVLITITTLY